MKQINEELTTLSGKQLSKRRDELEGLAREEMEVSLARGKVARKLLEERYFNARSELYRLCLMCRIPHDCCKLWCESIDDMLCVDCVIQGQSVRSNWNMIMPLAIWMGKDSGFWMVQKELREREMERNN